MPGNSTVPKVTLKVGGQAASEKLSHDIMEVVVDSNLNLPAMFTVQLYDDYKDGERWCDSDAVDIGKEVEIQIQAASQGGQSGASGLLIKGEITSLEPDFSEEGEATLVLRGYDKSHRLHRGKKTVVYADKTDSEIASAIAQAASLDAETDATAMKYAYVLQNNQTDMEFLLARAQRIGYRVYFERDKLHFKKAGADEGNGPGDLKWADNLICYKPRATAVNQMDKATVRGWNVRDKKAIEGKAGSYASPHAIGLAYTGPEKAKSAFGGSAEITIPNRPVSTVDEANAMAQSMLDMVGNDFIQASGRCFGDPRIQAGQKVNIKDVGTRFSGKYLITAATHVYNTAEDYETYFTVSGPQSRAVGNLIENNEHNGLGLITGVVPATVTNLQDKDNLGRVKVTFPTFGPEPGVESAWARVAAPMAGKSSGLMWLPAVGEEVLVAFEHGDANWPYIVGGLWNGKDVPPMTNEAVSKDGKVNQLVFKSRSGHTVIFGDEDGKETIIVRDKTEKNQIVIDSSKNTLTIHIEDTVTIESKGNIVIKSTDKDLSLEAKNVSIKSNQNLTIESTQNCDIKASQNVTLKASANFTAEGTAGVTVKDSGGAQIAMQGPEVNINNGALQVM